MSDDWHDWKRLQSLDWPARPDPIARALWSVAGVLLLALVLGGLVGYCTAIPDPRPRERALRDSLAAARVVAAQARARVETVTVTVTQARDRWLAAAAQVGTVSAETPPPTRALVLAGAELAETCGELVRTCGAAVTAESTRAAVAESLAVVVTPAGRRRRGAHAVGGPARRDADGAAAVAVGALRTPPRAGMQRRGRPNARRAAAGYTRRGRLQRQSPSGRVSPELRGVNRSSARCDACRCAPQLAQRADRRG